MPSGLQSLTSIEEAAVSELRAATSARAASGGIHGKPPLPPRGGRGFDHIRDLFNRSGSNSAVSGQSAALSQNSIIKQPGVASEEEVLSIRNRSRNLYSKDHNLDINNRNLKHPYNVMLTKGSNYSNRVLNNKTIYEEIEVLLANLITYQTNKIETILPDLTNYFSKHRGYLSELINDRKTMSSIEYKQYSKALDKIEAKFLGRLENSTENFSLLEGLLDLRDSYISSSQLEYFSNRVKVSF